MKPLDRQEQERNFAVFLNLVDKISVKLHESISSTDIQSILLNRPPNLLVECADIFQYEEGEWYCRGEMTVTEEHCAGHYPQLLILPFAQIGELIAQTGAVLLRKVSSQFASALPLVVEATELRGGNAGHVYPGDLLIVIVKLIRCRGGAARLTAVVFRDDEVVATLSGLKYLAVVPEEITRENKRGNKHE